MNLLEVCHLIYEQLDMISEYRIDFHLKLEAENKMMF